MISVVIPSYNSEATIRQCLNSLNGQAYEGDYEIILVDSSTDKTPEIVNSEFSNIKFIHLGQKTDPGTARNIGIEKSKGDLIAFIDSDCVAAPDWLKHIESAHISGYDIVGGSIDINNEEKDQVGYAGYIAEFREFLPALPKREAEHIPTCNISYKKRIFDKYGLFEGKYYPQEDLIYNYNLRKNEERILFDPTITVRHTHRSKLKDFLLHQKRIGRITARVLKVVNLQGAFIARRPLIALLTAPFLPLVKLSRTLLVFMRYSPTVVARRLIALSIFALGLFYWELGFLQGALGK